MSDTVMLIDISRVRPGKLGALKAAMGDLADFVAASDTRALSYEFFLSADESTMTVIQAHPDSASVEEQMASAAHIFSRFGPLLTMTAMDVYGTPSEELVGVLRRKAAMLGLRSGPAIHERAAGFSRLA
jgi:hypothetical protein